MGVFDYELYRQRQQEIELKALIALAKFGKQTQKYEALKHLEAIAYPLKAEIENGDIEGLCDKCGNGRCTDGTLTALTKNDLGIWCRRCVEYQ